MSWPPKPADLTEDAIEIPDNIRTFLSTLLTGNMEPPKLYSERVQRLVNSFWTRPDFRSDLWTSQDPQAHTSATCRQSLTNNVELIQIINRCGHGMSYSQIEEINTTLCLQRLASTPENSIPLPGNIKPYISTTLAWDNVDRVEETLSGEGTSHRVNGIAIQTIPGWTGFNNKVRNEEQVSQDNIGYLQTIDAPASNMSTVFEVLSQSLKIKDSLRLNAIVVVFDPAIYAKAMEIKWKQSEHFEDVIVRMGAFHTICTLLGIIGKRFQDAGLRDLCVESQVIAEGSVFGVMEGRKYNRAVRLHKLVYEALMRQVRSGFQKWVAEKHDEKTSLVDEMFSGPQSSRARQRSQI